MKDLISEYKKNLKETKEILLGLQQRIKGQESISRNEALCDERRLEAEEVAGILEQDRSIVASWVRNLEYSLTWMRTGKGPSNIRGIERRAAYERERPFDPMLMQRYFRSEEPVYEWDGHERESVVSSSDKDIIDLALTALTEREVEVYLMSRGHCLTQYAIADKLGISRNSVKTMLSRADKKIAKAIVNIPREGVC